MPDSPENTNPKIESCNARLDQAKKVFFEKTTIATNTFLDGVKNIIDLVPNKYLATAILAGGEAIGWGGYGLTDALTLISGIRDIAGGRLTENPLKAYLRGGLKIIAAIAPAIPTFWAIPVIEKTIPIPQLDNPPAKN